MTEQGVGVIELVSAVCGLALHLAFVFAFVAWGRRIAERRGGRGWRIASYLPIVAFVVPFVGLAGTVLGLVRAFGAVSAVDASHRAEALADGIQLAMLSTAVGIVTGLVLYVGCFVAFLYGSYGPSHRGDGPVRSPRSRGEAG